MATKRFNLTEVETGNNIGWYVASQAMFTGVIKFIDEKGTVLAKAEKTSKSQSYKVLGNGNFDFNGKSLHIEIEIYESNEIRQSILVAKKRNQMITPFIAKKAQIQEKEVIEAHIRTFVTDFSYDMGEKGRSALQELERIALSEL